MDRNNALRTIISFKKSNFEISHADSILTFGSCFSENIGEKLANNKFNTDINPFGVIFNPASIFKSIESLLHKRVFLENDLFFNQDKWSSYSHHSRFGDLDKNACLQTINQRINTSHENLIHSQFLILTFGTAWVYELKSTGEIVANCHKMPASMFQRYLLSECDITEMYSSLLKELWKVNPNLQVIFTISPVRHLKDGLEANFLSKSVLRMAIFRLMESFSQLHYFPSYEILLDDLRDYRFYSDDLCHPSSFAIDYIWQCFSEKYFSPETMELNKEINSIKEACRHRIFNPQSTNAKKFLEQTLVKIQNLETRYPSLDFQEEKKHLQKTLP